MTILDRYNYVFSVILTFELDRLSTFRDYGFYSTGRQRLSELVQNLFLKTNCLLHKIILRKKLLQSYNHKSSASCSLILSSRSRLPNFGHTQIHSDTAMKYLIHRWREIDRNILGVSWIWGFERIWAYFYAFLSYFNMNVCIW